MSLDVNALRAQFPVLHQEVKACEHELQGAASLPYVGFPVGITDTPERGYCVVARRPLQIGEVAWQCRPWAAVSSDACLSDTCAFCFRTTLLGLSADPPAPHPT